MSTPAELRQADLRRGWTQRVHRSLDGIYGPAQAEAIADALWADQERLYQVEANMTRLLYDASQEDPWKPGSGHMLPILDVFIRLNPHARAEVQGIRQAIARIEAERDARKVPPHMDGMYRTGIFHGLVLALHVLTNGAACDEDECEAHERDLLTPEGS